MTVDSDHLKNWISEIAALIERNENPKPEHYLHFLQEPEAALQIIDLISAMDNAEAESHQAYYSACVFALEICVAQLQTAAEYEQKPTSKMLSGLMSYLAQAILNAPQTLSFWLPILNAFYEVHVELSDELKNAYFELATSEPEALDYHEGSHLDSIRDLINEMAELSPFDIAENFFAQSYAMPPDFFADFVLDLYQLPEGQEIGLLALLHPHEEVRLLVLEVFETLMMQITLTPVSLSRLKVIRSWYPPAFHPKFDLWIRAQRKKGVVFHPERLTPKLQIQASEVDGVGAQGLFIHLHEKRKHRLCGVLLKQEVGIKDAWMTPYLPVQEVSRYFDDAFDDSVMLRAVDLAYFNKMVNHFLAEMVSAGRTPDLHLLEIQEALGVSFVPQRLEIEAIMAEFAIQIEPFTPETVQEAFKRTKSWTKNKRFTESWYVENSDIDTLVNQHCSFMNGVKVCQFEEAMKAVFEQVLELERARWRFHFLWTALWLKARMKPKEKAWQDSFMIAHAIHAGTPLDSIPILREICYQSVVNSIETMQDRRTYLNQASG